MILCLNFAVVCVACLEKSFILKDHLSNFRLMESENGNVVSADDYYPFGMTMPGHSYNVGFDRNIYKFSGIPIESSCVQRDKSG
ncbi:MAG: hypothetical protein JW956_06180 [Calditrichaceae bacterium]|nr:hypothetical protein [Calditrichaceae bacterium]